MFLGVCGGLAERVNIDPSLMRLAFVLGFFVTGSVLLWAYLLAGLIVPSRPALTAPTYAALRRGG